MGYDKFMFFGTIRAWTVWITFFILLTKHAYAEDIHYGDTWWKLRQIQSQHAPEISTIYEQIDADTEKGDVLFLGYRSYVRNQLSFWTDWSYGNFDREITGTGQTDGHRISTGLILHRQRESIRVGLGLSESADPGVLLSWFRPIGPYGSHTSELRRRRELDSYDSVRYGEALDSLKSEWTFDPPSPLFFAANFGLERRTLMDAERVHGKGYYTTWLSGIRFNRRADRRVGWQFYDPRLNFETSITEYIELSLQKRLEYFSAGDAFLNRIARTAKSKPTTLGLGIGLPISRHLAVSARVSAGEDSERDLNFGKVLTYNALFLIVLKNNSQISLNFNKSSENVGNISGDLLRVLLSYQVNL